MKHTLDKSKKEVSHETLINPMAEGHVKPETETQAPAIFENEISDSYTFPETGIKVILYMNGDVKQIDMDSGNVIEVRLNRRLYPDLTAATKYFLKIVKANQTN